MKIPVWDNLPPWAKAASLVGGALLVVGGGTVGIIAASVSIRRYYGQAFDAAGAHMPWATEHLGNSSATIGVDGCMLTALAMASNALNGTDWNPDDANQIVLSGDGFSGAELILPTAAATLDLFAPEAERIHAGQGNVDSMRALIDATLSQQGVALVNVDKTFTGTGEHFVLVYKQDSVGYAGADPATATDTYLDPATLSGVAMWGSTPHVYDAVGVAPIFRSA